MGRLRQVLVNLISNAVKFTNEGGVYLVVSLAQAEEGRLTLEFTVKDTGIGISSEKSIGCSSRSLSWIPQ